MQLEKLYPNVDIAMIYKLYGLNVDPKLKSMWDYKGSRLNLAAAERPITIEKWFQESLPFVYSLTRSAGENLYRNVSNIDLAKAGFHLIISS